MTVVVVGAAGMLGAVTVREWQAHGHNVVALTRADLDVTRPDQVSRALARPSVDVVINCTAYNRVDDAEGEPAVALDVNAWAVRSLAHATRRAGAVFVHYSTDFVFDGLTDRPYTEVDAANPQSAYGVSKLVGEWMAASCEPHYVLRVESLFGGAGTASTIGRMLDAFKAGRPVSAFSDRTVSPSSVIDVARATRGLVEGRAGFGLYHCVNSGAATWLDVAVWVRARAGCDGVPIWPIGVADVSLRARRPQFAALSNARLVAAGIPMPDWTDAIARDLTG